VFWHFWDNRSFALKSLPFSLPSLLCTQKLLLLVNTFLFFFVGKWTEDRISLDRNFISNVKTIHLVPWSKVLCLGLVDRIFDLVKKQFLIKWPKLRSSGQTLDQVKFDLRPWLGFLVEQWLERWGWRKGTLGLFCKAFKALRFSVFKIKFFYRCIENQKFFS
jgi:hypothetical protein